MSEQPNSGGVGLVRCVVCGKPIEMDEGDTLTIMEGEEPDHPDVTREDAVDAMVRAFRSAGGPKNHALADAYEDGEEIVMHDKCHDETALPGMYGAAEHLDNGE